MNRQMLRRTDGQVVRIRPPVQRRLPSGRFLEPMDDDWRVEAHRGWHRAAVRLHNVPTGHFFDVFPDGVQEFREPNTLIMKEQITLFGRAVQREPLADRRLAYARPMRARRVRPANAETSSLGAGGAVVIAGLLLLALVD